MKLSIKSYKYLKIKRIFKNENFILIYNTTNVKHFIKFNQKFKNLNFEYYQIYNNIAKKAFKKSIYKNIQYLLSNRTVTLTPIIRTLNLTLKNCAEIDESLYLIGLKLNTKVYSTSKLNSLLQLNYEKDHLMLLRFLKNRLKITHKLT